MRSPKRRGATSMRATPGAPTLRSGRSGGMARIMLWGKWHRDRGGAGGVVRMAVKGRIVTSAHRYKRPPRKRKAAALEVPAVTPPKLRAPAPPSPAEIVKPGKGRA